MAWFDDGLELGGLRRAILAAAGCTALVAAPACTDRAIGPDTAGDDDGDDDAMTSGDDDSATSGDDAGTRGDETADGNDDATADDGNPPPLPPSPAMCFADPDRFGDVRVCSDDLATCGTCDAECQAKAGAMLDEQGEFGCGGWELEGVTCSEQLGGQCCQVVQMYDVGCAGRPFEVQGAARVAGTQARDDWRGGVAVDVRDLDATTRASLAAYWREVAQAEHASVASFARFTIDLMAMGAPPSLLVRAQRAALDEVEHARRCFALASAYGGTPVGPARFDAGEAAVRDDAAIVRAAVLEGCVEETISAALAVVAADRTRDPAVAGALYDIARDEESHAALAWAFVRWVADTRPELRPTIAAAFAESERTRSAVQADPAPDEVDLSAHGRLDAGSHAATVRATWRDIVAPARAALL